MSEKGDRLAASAMKIVAFGEMVRLAMADAEALGKGEELKAEIKAVMPIFQRDGQTSVVLRAIRKILGWRWTVERGLEK